MGYYTYFEMEMENLDDNSNVTEEEVIKTLIKESAWFDEWDRGKYFEELFYDGLKWYDWEDDMKKVSLSFPNVVFSLMGRGEEYDDLWKCVFYKGKSFYSPAKIIYDEPPMSFFE